MLASGPDTPLPVGAVLRDTYTIEQVLGRGTFGTVYQVQHRYLGRQAMKVFHRSSAPVETVLAEAQLLTTLVHAHIVRIFEANTIEVGAEQSPYMTMEWLPGGNLDDLLERKLRLDVEIAFAVARQICDGLTVAHQASPAVVHRDVKPANVLVQSISARGQPRVKLGDFGLACTVNPQTMMSSAAGTMLYLAPEAAWGYYTTASDIYALGIVLFRMLTGVFPFRVAPTSPDMPITRVRDVVLHERRVAPPVVSRFRPGVPAEIDECLSSMLHPDAGLRFPDAATLGKHLEGLKVALS